MRRALLRVAASLSLLAFAPAVHAAEDRDCDPASLDIVDAWLAAHPWRHGTPAPEKRIAATCKPSPLDANVLIVACAYDIGPEKNTVVALVDLRKEAVRAAYKGVIVEVDDLTVYAGSLSIDTARYDLAPGVRAFGITVTSSRHSGGAAEAGGYDGRTLFVQQGAVLRPVLTGFLLHTWEWPGRAGDGPQTHDYTLAIGTHSSHGYADLVVTDSIQGPSNGELPRRHRFVLRYDGTAYKGRQWGDWGVEPEAVADPAPAGH